MLARLMDSLARSISGFLENDHKACLAEALKRQPHAATVFPIKSNQGQEWTPTTNQGQGYIVGYFLPSCDEAQAGAVQRGQTNLFRAVRTEIASST